MLSGTKTRDPAARTSPARRSARCSSRRHPLLLPQDRLARAPQPGDAGPGDHPRSTPSRHSLPFTSTTSPARLGRLWRLLLHPLGGAFSTPLLQPTPSPTDNQPFIANGRRLGPRGTRLHPHHSTSDSITAWTTYHPSAQPSSNKTPDPTSLSSPTIGAKRARLRVQTLKLSTRNHCGH